MLEEMNDYWGDHRLIDFVENLLGPAEETEKTEKTTEEIHEAATDHSQVVIVPIVLEYNHVSDESGSGQ